MYFIPAVIITYVQIDCEFAWTFYEHDYTLEHNVSNALTVFEDMGEPHSNKYKTLFITFTETNQTRSATNLGAETLYFQN